MAGEGVPSFSELVPNPFAERSCDEICSNQIQKKILWYCVHISTRILIGLVINER